MNINNQINKVFYALIFISCSSMSNHFDEDNVCFYSNDGYIEKGGGRSFVCHIILKMSGYLVSGTII